MIKDIIKAINSRLKEHFPYAQIQSRDVEEGFFKPSFFVDVVDYNKEIINPSYRKALCALTIYYFPENERSRIELLNVREELEECLLGPLAVDEETKINILDLETNETDGVLRAELELEFYYFIPEAPGELIETLHYNEEVKG